MSDYIDEWLEQRRADREKWGDVHPKVREAIERNHEAADAPNALTKAAEQDRQNPLLR